MYTYIHIYRWINICMAKDFKWRAETEKYSSAVYMRACIRVYTYIDRFIYVWPRISSGALKSRRPPPRCICLHIYVYTHI